MVAFFCSLFSLSLLEKSDAKPFLFARFLKKAGRAKTFQPKLRFGEFDSIRFITRVLLSATIHKTKIVTFCE